MNLVNKKPNKNDRITDLPSNVIDAILANLGIRDQVRTSVLSKKWRYTWTSAPQICFDDDFFERFLHLDDPYPVFCKIITDVLMLHNGPIHKFSIIVVSEYYEFDISIGELNMWIPFMSRDIKHLELLTCYTPQDQIPNILFSCKELTYFKFSSFNLSIPPNFCGFKKLLELHLDCIQFEFSALESFMSGCPILQKLSIERCIGCDHLDISSPSLKVLVLELYSTKSVCLKKANNLIDFTLNGYPGIGFIRSLPEIKRFSLDRWMEIPLADIIPPTLLTSSFSSLEYLQLNHSSLKDKGELLYIVNILKSAPRLIELTIQQSYDNIDDTTQVLDPLKELECLSCCCLKLQTVNIYVDASTQHGMSLIKFILANSPLLKTLTFNYISEDLDAVMLFGISQDLLLMERASPRAQVKFLHSTYP